MKNTKPVLTKEQYTALPTPRRIQFDEYVVEFWLKNDDGFWARSETAVYSRGKSAHGRIEAWLKKTRPGAERIKIWYQ